LEPARPGKRSAPPSPFLGVARIAGEAAKLKLRSCWRLRSMECNKFSNGVQTFRLRPNGANPESALRDIFVAFGGLVGIPLE
jgi:hypothetical protein